MKKILLCILLLFVVAVFSFAANDSITVSPIKVDMTIDANSSYENIYEVTNNYSSPITVEILTESWNTFSGNGTLDINSWLIVEPRKIKLKAGETGIVKYKVLTSSTMTGSLSAMVSFMTRPPGQEMFKMRLTTFLHAHIRGTQKIDFEILDARLEKSGDFTFGKVSVKNKGNTHIRPMGTYIMKGPKIKYRGNILQDLPVYAESQRDDIEFVIPKGLNLLPGKYSFQIFLRAEGKMVAKTIKARMNKDGFFERLK